MSMLLVDVEKQFSLVTSVHPYSVSPKMDQPIADGVVVVGSFDVQICNSVFQALDVCDSDPSRCVVWSGQDVVVPTS